MGMKEVKITLLANADEKDLEKTKRLTHHAEGIYEEYLILQNMSVSVEILGEGSDPDKAKLSVEVLGEGSDPYKVKQLETMLAHETASGEEHYGAKLSHWYGDTKTLTIDAGGLRALKEYYETHRTEL